MKHFYKNLTRNQKIGSLIIILLLLAIIIFSFATIIYRQGKTKVIIKIAPKEATITLNDTRVSNYATHWLEPGNYHLKASYNEHLATYEANITVATETVEIYSLLNSLDDEGRQFIENHQQEYQEAEGLTGYLANKEGSEIKDQYPILNYLPMNTPFYSISYSYDDNNKPIINIKADAENLNLAVAKIKLLKDVDLSSQNITFSLKNNFEKYQANNEKDFNSFIHKAFNLSENQYTSGINYIKDNYYYSTIYLYDSYYGENNATYKVLLQKSESGEWSVVSTPQPILTIYNTPNVDKEILDIINSN